MADLSFLTSDIHLVGIPADGGTLESGWFGFDRQTAERWAHEANTQRYNIYWTCNVVRPQFVGKPKKSDIVGVRFAHADVDDTQEPGRIEQLAPSFIINSGNGLQPLWRIDGACTATEIEDINRRLMRALDCDACWNVDRLLRVPGTMNWPTPTKRARGRKPVFASMIIPDRGTRYALANLQVAFPPVPALDEPADVDFGSDWTPLRIADAVPPIRGRLLHMVTDVQPKGYRSEHVTKCVKALGGEGYTNEQIVGLLMHPENEALHGTIADQAYPLRQAIRKLKYAAIDRKDPAAIFGTAPPAYVPPDATPTPAVPVSRQRPGTGLLMQDQQQKWFSGDVYVADLNKILTRDGDLLDQQRFDVLRAGYDFIYSVDGSKSTKSAWDAYLKNHNYQGLMASGLCFRPTMEFQTMVYDAGRMLVNSYRPMQTPTMPGDVRPFLMHVAKMLPEERDQKILLTYMASCLQNPGVKFQWWPVIQGTPGNGKTLLLDVMEFCIGAKYSHRPNASKLTRQGVNFNGWIAGKLFLGLEEIYSANRRDFLEEFKPYVTNIRLPIESKGQDEYTGDNFANGMLLTNHRDGVPITQDERRYCPLFTAQQEVNHLQRDAMTEHYFVPLWRWLRGDGFAIINGYLRSLQLIAEYDPAQLATRAPITSSTRDAIEAGRTLVEQVILDAIDDALSGFANGWVSTAAVSKILQARRLSSAGRTISTALRNIGYVPHPALDEGKTVRILPPENTRTRLYVKSDSLLAQMPNRERVMEKYSEDQIAAATGVTAAAFGVRP